MEQVRPERHSLLRPSTMANRHHNFDFEEAAEPPRGNKILRFLKSNALTLATLGGVLIGGTVGFVLRNSKDDWTDREVMYIGYIGEIFLRMLKGLIIPLILSSLVSAIANLDLSLSSKIAMRAIAYYLTTTFAAVVLGMILVTAIGPGRHFTDKGHTSEYEGGNVSTVDTLMDLLRNMFPPNMIEATIYQYHTELTQPENSTDPDILTWDISTKVTRNTNILGLVVIGTAIGIAIAQLGEEARVMAKFFDNLMSVSMKVTQWVIFLSPVGVTFLVIGEILKMDNIADVMKSLGLYFATVLIGLAIQGFVVLPLLFYLLTRRNPLPLMQNLTQAVVTGFGTASSSATLPVTIRCLEEKEHIDSRVARFCLPIGSTINMDGTALYEAIAAIFIAQVRGRSLGFGNLVAISITATAASIGAAGIPQAGLVTLVMVLDTVGLPATDVGLILAVDWFLDRFRTAINILGDSFGAVIVYYRSLNELGLMDKKSSENVAMNEKLNSEKTSDE